MENAHSKGTGMKPRKATREQLKRHNRQMLLRAVYYGLADNRAALAAETGLAKPTVSDLVAELIEEGLLTEGGRGESTEGGGKRPTLVQFVPDSRQVIGVSMETNRIFGVLCNLTGKVIAQHYAEFDHVQGDEAVNLLIEVTNGLKAQLDAPLLCMGVGVSGAVESETGVVQQSSAFAWENLPLRNILTHHYGTPAYVGNNTELTAVAQFAFGMSGDDGARNLVTVRVSRGVEVGVAWDGVSHHHGSDISSLCVDGEAGDLQSLLGWEAVTHRIAVLRRDYPDSILPAQELSYLHLRYAAANEDALALHLIDELADHLARVMAWVIGLLRPNHISLTGAVVNLGQSFLDLVVLKTGARLSSKLSQSVKFSLAYSANLSAIGAAAYAIQKELDVI
jgi:predicted NBD/HSP70 family sugar kinase